MVEFWDERYDTKEFVYGKHPNDLFKEFIDKTPKGSILLPAEGEGRNAIYAALKGWEVTAFDFSIEARKKAMQLAYEYQVHIDYHISPIEDFETSKKFDAVALIFLHLPPHTRQNMHRKLINFLKPGGYYIMESFSRKQFHLNTGGPKNMTLLYNGQELIEDLRSLKLMHYKEKLRKLYEGSYHKGEAEVIQLISKKLN
jgi:2-polyprenyl-3-methyl-5-hydroxy-6-metoxy-1,4-benzoquinol methylase